MDRIDVEYDNGKIEEYLLQDSLQRNKYLDKIITFLNNVEGQLILNLNDDWGTGKTVFLKQLEFLNTSRHENISGINLDKIKAYQENYEIFYFNAWEHDLYNSPLESLVYNLLLRIQELDEEILVEKKTLEYVSNKLKQLGVLFGNTILKAVSAGQIDLETFKDSQEAPSSMVTSIEVKREAINSIIQYILDSSDKKLLIIVDELDRCKPIYAVEFLEIIKHFFVNDDVVFIFGTNKKELSETIRGQYGSGFDGYKYLNRFFDFEFSLPNIKIADYINFVGKMNYSSSQYYTLEMNLVAKYFNFTMRDINRYISICDMCHKYWRTSDYYVEAYQKYILIPFAIGLKIYSGSDYQSFISGKGRNILEAYYNYDIMTHNKIITHSLERKGIKWKDNENFEESCRLELLTFYNELNRNGEGHSDSAYAMSEILELLSMMSSHTD